MKLDLNENDMMFATIIILAGALSAIAIKQMEIICSGYQAPQYNAFVYDVPPIVSRVPAIQMIEPPIENDLLPYDSTLCDVEPVKETNVSELSPVTYLGYNEEDDLVGVMKRMPDGKVMRRKIRDPDMSLADLEVNRWVEYNEWNNENEMNWI